MRARERGRDYCESDQDGALDIRGTARPTEKALATLSKRQQPVAGKPSRRAAPLEAAGAAAVTLTASIPQAGRQILRVTKLAKSTTRLEKLGGSHTCPQEVQREATKSTTKWIGAAQRRLPKVHPSLYLINAGPVSRSEHLSARLTISCISGKQAFRYQKRSVGHGAA